MLFPLIKWDTALNLVPDDKLLRSKTIFMFVSYIFFLWSPVPLLNDAKIFTVMCQFFFCFFYNLIKSLHKTNPDHVECHYQNKIPFFLWKVLHIIIIEHSQEEKIVNFFYLFVFHFELQYKRDGFFILFTVWFQFCLLKYQLFL